MTFRALLRRAFPYLVIGIGGFALAYVLIFVFVLPSKIVPRSRTPVAGDTSSALQPIDTAMHADSTVLPLQLSVAPERQQRTIAPDVVGMALPDARTILNGDRVRTIVQRDTSSVQPPNTVLSQSPAANAPLGPDGAVTLTVSQPLAAAPDTTAKPRNNGMSPILRADSDSTKHDTTTRPQR